MEQLEPGPSKGSVAAAWQAGYSRFCGVLATAAEIAAVAAIAADVAITGSGTLLRYGFHTSVLWSEDATSIALSVISFVGSAAMFRRGGIPAFTYAIDRMPRTVAAAFRSSALWVIVFALALLLTTFPSFLADSLHRDFPQLHASEAWSAVWLGVGSVLTILFAFEAMSHMGGRAVVLGLLPAVIGSGVIAALRWLYLDLGFDALDPLVPAVLAALVVFVAGVPIAYVLLVAGLTYFVITGAHVLLAASATVVYGVSSILLVAVPFFLLAGALLQLAGIAQRLGELLDAWFGHLPGGLLIVTVIAMYIFSGISGSKAADVAAVGSALRTTYRDRLYPMPETAAVLAASAAMGETVPPSIALLVLGGVTTLSIGALLLAGILPAAILAVALIAAVVFRARGGRLPRSPQFSPRRALRAIPLATPALLVPIIVIGGIVGGIATPEEASSLAAIFGLCAAFIVYRSLTWTTTWELLRGSVLTSGMILVMVAMASLLSQAILFDGLSDTLTQLMGSIGGHAQFLLISALLLILLGIGFEGLPAILVFAPLLIPIAAKVGVDPLQYGIVLVMAMGIGVFSPPLGIGLYITSAIVGVKVHETFRPSLFYTGIVVAGLVLVIFLPELTLFLPRLAGFR